MSPDDGSRTRAASASSGVKSLNDDARLREVGHVAQAGGDH